MIGQGMSNQLSNVLGVAIPYDLKRQMQVRSEKLSNERRSTNDIQYLANKSCWVRLVSSVRVKDLEYFRRFFPNLNMQDGDSLAKKFVLFAGTSEYINTQTKDSGFQYLLRSGFGANGSYGTLGDVETKLYGYRPMPGITDARIETQGKLGSIRSATINFKVWDKSQLDIVDALYFKLGYTMFLEWGHTTYFDNGDGDALSTPQLKRSDLKQIDPFAENLKKEIILREISTRIDESNGNYDAMLGMCTNFNFSMNQDGGYDCSIRLIALGDLASQIKINQPNALPTILSSEIKKLIDIYTNILREKARQERLAAEQADDIEAAKNPSSQPIQKYGVNETLMAADPTRYGGGKDIATELINEDSVIPAKYINSPELRAFNEKYPDFRILNSSFGALSLSSLPPEERKAKKQEVELAKKEYDQILSKLDKESSKNYETYGDVLYNYSSPSIPGVSPLGPGLYSKTFGVYIPTEPTNIPKFISSFSLDGKILSEAFNQIYSDSKNWTADKNDILESDRASSITGAGILDNDSYYYEYRGLGHKAVYWQAQIGPNKLWRPVVLFYSLPDLNFKSGQNPEIFTFNTIAKDIINGGDRQVALSNIRYKIIKKISGKYSDDVNKSDFQNLFRIRGVSKMPITTTRDADIVEGTSVTSGRVTTSGTRDIEWSLYFADTSFIKDIQPTSGQGYLIPQRSDTTTATATPNVNPEDQINIDVDSVQAQEKLNYQSGLEVFIRSIQLHSFNIGYTDLGVKDGKIGIIDLYDKKNKFIKDLFDNGVLSKVSEKFATDKIIEYKDIKESDNAAVLMSKYASYGFNHNLMSQPFKTQKKTIGENKIPQVNFKDLYKSYVVPYSVNQGIAKDIDINYPVYIKFGLLIMALNHMCTIYDSKEGKSLSAVKEEQTPLVYIDFNPETNFCLSDPLQMSTDPLKILIPFRGTDSEYAKLFDPKLINSGKIIAPSESAESKDLFKPQSQDYLSSQLPQFKGINLNSDAYSGKIMNILLSCDYLLSLCKNFANNDQSQSVKLRPFLQQIIDDINKYLGGINLLRLAYDDKSNCLYITDDQIQPIKLDEKSVPSAKLDSEIPVFGKKSIARSLEIRTDISSKLSNMIAISANSDIKSDSSKDATPFGHFNENYTDRFIPQVLSINANTNDDKEKQTSKANDTQIAAANAFNDFVKCALNTGQVSDGNISAATNYYIERMNKRKGENAGTKSSAMIPISVNFSTDGISGLSMGHAFLLPEAVMPKSYEPKNDGNLIGFVVTGLNHTLQNNSWTTDVKANMMYLKDDSSFKVGEKTYNIKELSSGNFIIVPAENTEHPNYSSQTIPSNYPSTPSSYPNVKFSNIGLGNPASDKINPNVLKDISDAAVKAGVTVSVTTAVSGHHTSPPSRHTSGNAVDIAIIDGIAVNPNASNISKIKEFTQALVDMGYIKNKEYGNPKAVLTFGFPNHSDHVHVSNKV